MSTITREFVTAGNATFTVELPAGSDKPHYTFRVRRSEPTPQFPKPAYFVSLLTGPDNESSYSYVGLLNRENGAVRTTAKSKIPADSYVVRLLGRVLLRVWNNEQEIVESAGFRLHHEGKCCRCGRKLTVPESIESGIGPECREMAGW